VFSPTTISLTPRFCQKRKVWLRFFAENAQNDPKTHSYEDNAKFNSAFSATMLRYASRFRRKRGMIEHFEYLSEFVEVFRKCWLYCVLYILVIKRCKKKFSNRLWKSRACVPLRDPRGKEKNVVFIEWHLKICSDRSTSPTLWRHTNDVTQHCQHLSRGQIRNAVTRCFLPLSIYQNFGLWHPSKTLLFGFSNLTFYEEDVLPLFWLKVF
jgi:hypothetical protein